MIVEFDTLSPNSKIWIFQSDRMLNTNGKKTISEALNQFLNSWMSHGVELCVSFTIRYDIFIIVGVDTEYLNASGCSIDKLMLKMGEIGKGHSIDFFNRSNICVLNGETIRIFELKPFKELIKNGKIDSETLIFHNTLFTKSQLESEWKTKIQDSWLKKYLSVHV